MANILAVDVQYVNSAGYVAGVIFNQWSDCSPVNTVTCKVDKVEDYVAGKFYKRELPCILALLDENNLTPQTIIIDGYVYLDGDSIPGLGGYLYSALSESVNVIGVAKRAFSGISEECELLRGTSNTPLYITSAGEALGTAKHNIESMCGEYRIPTLLKLVDRQCRAFSDQAHA